MTEFLDGFTSGIKAGPRLFFAPVAFMAKSVSSFLANNRR